jgi:hypothetical protein
MTQVLRYESNDGGSLEAGEHLIWEGGGVRRGRPRFRITSRRAFCIDGKENVGKHRATVRWPYHRMITVGVSRSGLATIHFDTTLWLLRVQDWATVAGYLVNLNRGRLTRRRRGSPPIAPETVMDAIATDDIPQIEYASIASDLGLIEGERVLWTGRPIVQQPIRWPMVRKKLITLAGLCVACGIAYGIFQLAAINPMSVIGGIIAVIWIPLALHALTTKPLIDRWRLGRTQYVLTSRRAFVLEPWRGGRRVRFIFVDSLPSNFSRVVQDDGSGDVTVGHLIVFRQIPESAVVHGKLVAAVLSARKDLPDLGWQDGVGHGMDG